MRIRKYATLQNQDHIVVLEKEEGVQYSAPQMRTPGDIAKMMREVFRLHERTEEFVYLLCFDTKFRLIGTFEVSHGALNYSVCNPREIFVKALLCNAGNIVIVHNHPSGDETPSKEDVAAYERIKKSGELLQVPLVDSIIIGRNAYYSFLEH